MVWGRSADAEACHASASAAAVATMGVPALAIKTGVRPPNPPKPDNAPSFKLVEDLRSKAHNGELYGVVIRGSFTG